MALTNRRKLAKALAFYSEGNAEILGRRCLGFVLLCTALGACSGTRVPDVAVCRYVEDEYLPVAKAMRNYYLSNGRFPLLADELVPEYIAEIPKVPGVLNAGVYGGPEGRIVVLFEGSYTSVKCWVTQTTFRCHVFHD